jgi:hypothetical protein
VNSIFLLLVGHNAQFVSLYANVATFLSISFEFHGEEGWEGGWEEGWQAPDGCPYTGREEGTCNKGSPNQMSQCQEEKEKALKFGE